MEGKCYITSFRDLRCIGAGFRSIMEQPVHFLRTFHIELSAFIPHPVFIQNGFARLDTQEDIMGICIFLINVVAVIGGDEGDTCFRAHFYQRLIDHLLLSHAMILQFQEEIPFPEDLQIFQRRFLCFFIGNRQNVSGHFPGKTCTGSDQTLAVSSQKFLIHTGLIIEAFRKSIRNQLDQILIAFIIFCKEHHVIITAALAFFFETRALRHIDLAADDGLYPCIQRSFVKLYRAIHGTVICDGDAVHAQFFHPLHQFLDFRRTIQQAIFCVDVKMCKWHVFLTHFFLFQITHLRF